MNALNLRFSRQLFKRTHTDLGLPLIFRCERDAVKRPRGPCSQRVDRHKLIQ